MNRRGWMHWLGVHAASLVVFTLGLGFMSGTVAAQGTPRLEERACDFPIASAEIQARLRCGTVKVLRDPSQPEDGTFELAVVVKRSAQPKPGALPVLILHGGPGGQQTPYMGRGAADYIAGHDSIAFDMRGGGRTGPRFCETLHKELLDAQREHMLGRARDPARSQALARCVESFQALGLRPEHFGTDRNVDDAEAVRQALAIDRWAVYSMSYGTTVAAEYLIRHPQVLSAVVLDSPYPPDAFVHPVREAQRRAIEALLTECRHEPACAERFPALTTEAADAALRRLQQTPLTFSWEGQTLRADEAVTRSALHGLLYSETTARTVPWLLDAVMRGDGVSVAAALALPLVLGEAGADSGQSAGGLLATDCRDRARHHAVSGSLRGDDLTWMELLGGLPDGSCQPWPLGHEPRLPAATEVPVLLLTAGYDGFQPDGAAMAKLMGPRAQAYGVPRAAHVVRGSGPCARRLISQFLLQPSDPVDATCLADQPATGFLLDARPVPAVALAVPRAMAGSPPVALVAWVLGVLVWAVSCIAWPVLRWSLWRVRGGRAMRSDQDPLFHSGTRTTPRLARRLALTGGLFLIIGVGLSVAGTMIWHPDAAILGLHPVWAMGLWGLPLGLAVSAVALGYAARSRQVLPAIGSAGAVCVALSSWALGLMPA